MDSAPDAPRLYLITPPIGDAAAFKPLLEVALGAVDVACVLLRVAARDEGEAKSILRALVPVVQAHDAAALVERDARLAARVDADGVHLRGPDRASLDEALGASRSRKAGGVETIVGVGALPGRDAAMEAGEKGVDYLMFGFPGGPDDPDAVVEQVSWWAEIFNVPCVGYVAHPDDAVTVARAGAEFVALCEGLWDAPGTLDATLRAVAAAVVPVGDPR